MTEADRVHSTPPLNSSASQTRRTVLAGVAGALSLSTVAGTVTAGRALAALPAAAAAAEPDPIFAAIEAHRKAKAAADAAWAEVERLQKLADETVGPLSISVLDMREPSDPPGWHPYVDAGLVSEIWELVPGEENKDLRDLYLEKLAERQAAWMAIAGNTDAITEEPCDAYWDSIDEFIDTVPATMAGLLAMALTFARPSASSCDAAW